VEVVVDAAEAYESCNTSLDGVVSPVVLAGAMITCKAVSMPVDPLLWRMAVTSAMVVD
jgi:hypothetical protein